MSVLQDKKILVVDDEEEIREIVVSEFEFNGCVCVQAANGTDAFELYKKEKFDAVVSDIRMPNGDGLYFLEKVKESEVEPCVMVFMTGFSDIPLEEFYNRGVEAVLAKPFRLDQLVKTVEMSMNSPRMSWRREPRISAVLNIELNWAGLAQPLRTKTFNVGRGGFFVQCHKNMPRIGTQATFQLMYTRDGKNESVSGEVVVRWVRSEVSPEMPSGFGAEFSGLSQEQMDDIASMAGLARTRVFIPKA